MRINNSKLLPQIAWFPSLITPVSIKIGKSFLFKERQFLFVESLINRLFNFNLTIAVSL